MLHLAVGDVAVDAGLVGGPDDSGLVGAVLEVAVHAVVAGIDLAADKPLCVGHMPLHDGVPFAEPVQISCHLAPKTRRIIFRAMPHGFVLLLTVDVSTGGKRGGRRKGSSFLQNTVDTLVARLSHTLVCSCAIKTAC